MKPCSHAKRPAPGPIQAHAVMFVPGFPQQRRRIPFPALCARTELRPRWHCLGPDWSAIQRTVCPTTQAHSPALWGLPGVEYDRFEYGGLPLEPNSPVLQRISCTDNHKRRASPPDLRDLRRIPGGKVDLNRIASFVHHPLAHRESTRRVSQIPAVATLRSRASARPSRWRCWRASPRGLAAFERRPRRSRAEAST
jgi:hypothetical protein